MALNLIRTSKSVGNLSPGIYLMASATTALRSKNAVYAFQVTCKLLSFIMEDS